MPTVQKVKDTLPRGTWSGFMDPKNIHWYVPFHEFFRLSLGFCIGSKKHRFKSRPLGLNFAPLVFTRLESTSYESPVSRQ